MSIVKTTVTFKCGHTEEFETLGEMRQATIDIIKNNILCSDCCLEKFKEVDKERSNDFPKAVSLLNLANSDPQQAVENSD